MVAPFAGAWIEISAMAFWLLPERSSLPSRERGLKSSYLHAIIKLYIVAPFAGAWIEMENDSLPVSSFEVAPFAGAWIEIGI